MDKLKPVVSATWLKEQLDTGDTDLRVLDVSWYSAKNAHEEYIQKHIPGAAHFDIMHGVTHTELFPRNIPDCETFEAYVRSFGISDSTHVVVYDTNLQGQNGFFAGGRAWWLFELYGHTNVSVLDGGLNKWEELHYPTTSQLPTYEGGTFKACYTLSLRKTYEQMKENLSTKYYQVCDSRAEHTYNGHKDDQKTGHIPGAISLPLKSSLLDHENGTIKEASQLKQIFETSGVDLSKPIATNCSSGMSSCALALALRMAGARDVGVFHGGFTQWTANGEPTEQS